MANKGLERKIAKNIKKDSKTFFKYARSKTTVKSSVGPLDNNGTLISDDHAGDEADVKYIFASVFTTKSECQNDLPTSPTIFHGCEEDILSIISY